ncbi:MAG TPA: GNAT family N-acetyltransferase [Acidimicrobiales bacterium]|nr:GNAT family N-acetyltransferase [Acidimicrobiales bacterium]
MHLALPAEDQEAVRRLILDGLAERWSGQLDESPNPDLADLASAHPHGRIVVGRLDAEIVATGIVKPAGPGLAEIVRMSVAAGHRRSGHGRQILQALLAAAREGSASRVVLETCDSWEGVVSFYLAAEFSINHYRDSPWCRDAYFVLDLPPG